MALNPGASRAEHQWSKEAAKKAAKARKQRRKASAVRGELDGAETEVAVEATMSETDVEAAVPATGVSPTA